MTRVLAFAVIFLVGTACHVETKRVKLEDVRDEEHVVTNSVTTAPTERTTRTWKFSITPGVGRSLPNPGTPGVIPLLPPHADFAPFVGQGYALDEYQEVTEKLAPVATTSTKTDKNSETKTAEKSDEDTDIGFSLKFYLLAGGLLAAVAALGIFLSRSQLIRRLLGVPL